MDQGGWLSLHTVGDFIPWALWSEFQPLDSTRANAHQLAKWGLELMCPLTVSNMTAPPGSLLTEERNAGITPQQLHSQELDQDLQVAALSDPSPCLSIPFHSQELHPTI